MPPSPRSSPSLGPLVVRALERRRPLLARADTQAFRAFSGLPDGRDGLFIDVYGPGAALIVHEQDAAPTPPEAHAADAAAVLEALAPVGVRAVYLKPFAKDRSRLGGELPPCTTDPTPAAGDPLPDHLLVRELHWTLEVRLHDGLSTGLFIDQRANRRFLHHAKPRKVLNTFAYTCSFSVVAALVGAETVSVDLSKKSIDRGRENFALNRIDAATHRFYADDVLDVLPRLARKHEQFDAIILDPPTFSRGNNGRKFQVESDLETLLLAAFEVATPRAKILLSTNCTRLNRRALEAIARFACKTTRRAAEFHAESPLPDIPTEAAAQTLWLLLR